MLKSNSKPDALSPDFTHQQKEHFIEAEVQRFHWQTENPFIREQETRLLNSLAELLKDGDEVLEVGAGEGANLVNLDAGTKHCSIVAIDFSAQKSELCNKNAQQAQPNLSCTALCADATKLPFASNTFNVVYCRDLLHHIDPAQKQQVVSEMVRVCKPGGKLLLIESNGRNPIITLHALLIKAERGELQSSPKLFKRLVEQANGKNLVILGKEPLPFFRLLLHYRFGLPKLGTNKAAVKVLGFLDKVFGVIIPKSFWAYSVVSADVPTTK